MDRYQAVLHTPGTQRAQKGISSQVNKRPLGKRRRKTDAAENSIRPLEIKYP